MKRLLSLAAAAIIAASAYALPEFGSGKVGDAAPALEIAQWVKGAPVELKKDKVYVVEFWATWCPPCRKSIPHLTELQKKYKGKGVTIIGISDEDEATVRPFVEQQGKTMDYTVAVDKDQQTTINYMYAYGQEGIPTAFVVDEGKVAWVGSPFDPKMEAAIEKAIDEKPKK